MAERRLPPLAVGIYLITAICGTVDAACFLGLGHVFAEVLTGNMVLLSFAIGYGPSSVGGPIVGYVVAIGTFVAGALAGGKLLTMHSPLTDRRIGFAAEWVALVGAVVATVVLHPQPTGSSRLVVIAFLAFGMGIQNAMIRKWGIPDLATNVMTLTITGLVSEWSLVGGDNHHAGRRATSVGLFAVSAVFGAALTRFGIVWPLLAALVIFSVALPILLQPERPHPEPSKGGDENQAGTR